MLAEKKAKAEKEEEWNKANKARYSHRGQQPEMGGEDGDETKEEDGEKEEATKEEAGKVELSAEESAMWYRKHTVPDLTPSALAKSFADFSIPDKAEGFDEIKYVWQEE